MNLHKKHSISPYLGGAGIGLISIASIYFFGKTLGTSSTFTRIGGAIQYVVDSEAFSQMTAYTKYLKNAPLIDWQFALVAFVFIGSFIAARMTQYTPPTVPKIWKETIGSSEALRHAAAFIGGIIIIFGARIAGGCTSGHVISGGLQLSVAGWLFMASFFVSGVATALLLYRKKG